MNHLLVSDVIAAYLKAEGIESVYVYPGGTIAPMINSLVSVGIRIEVFKHEQGALYAALAAARLTKRLQVAMVTSGPGVTNALTPLADAYYDSTPLLLITGQVGTGDLFSGRSVRQRGFQHAFLGVIDDGRTGIFRTRGNKYCHLVLRGGSNGTNFGSEYVAFSKEILRKAGLAPAMIVDCSHGNSNKECGRQSIAFRDALDQISHGETAIRGLMLESYIIAGRQDINIGKMTPGLSVMDACIGWEETESIIREAHSKLSPCK